MELYTPLARLGTFLFPSQSRRITAPPPPQSPHEPSKRRSAVAACDSPPRCRRRLSFADTDVVIEYTQSPGDAEPGHAIAALVASFPQLSSERRVAAWKELANLARAQGSFAGLGNAALRALFVPVFARGGEGCTQERQVEELEAAVFAFDAVLSTTLSPLTSRDGELVAGVLRALACNIERPLLVDAVVSVVLRHDWGRVFVEVMYEEADPLSHAILSQLRNEEVEPYTWEALLQLLRVCAEAQPRYLCVGGGPPVMGESVVQIEAEDAKAILASFERLGDRDDACTESALRALVPLFKDRRVAATFVQANGSAVFWEVSLIHRQKLAVQHACIDLLVAMSSPKTLSVASAL